MASSSPANVAASPGSPYRNIGLQIPVPLTRVVMVARVAVRRPFRRVHPRTLGSGSAVVCSGRPTIDGVTQLAGGLRVVMVVIDAMPHRHVGAGLTPNLWRQAASGGRAPMGGLS